MKLPEAACKLCDAVAQHCNMSKPILRNPELCVFCDALSDVVYGDSPDTADSAKRMQERREVEQVIGHAQE